MKMQIKHRNTGSVLFEIDAENIGEAVEAAVAAKADLRSADLRSAYLSYADLSSADLRSADLSYANLSSADLSYANLSSADLRSAYLRSANLSYANLSYADLRYAYLSYADLSYADLRSADLSYAKGSDKDVAEWQITRTILPSGDIIGWKKLLKGVVCKLLIPAMAKRVGGLAGRKCRAEYAKVLSGPGISSREEKYVVGKIVRPDKYDPNPLVECSHGIHFFITREEAERYEP